MGGTTVAAPPAPPSMEGQIAVMTASDKAKNAAFLASLQEQPLLFQMARDMGTAQQAQGGQVLSAAGNLAALQQGLGKQYLNYLGSTAADQTSLGGQYLGAQTQGIAAQQALQGQYLGQAGQVAAQQQQLGAGFLGAARDLAAGQQALGGQALKSQTELAKGQQQLAQNALSAQAQTPPEAIQFNADQTSKEASELGMANLARARQNLQLVNPQAAAMQASMGQKVADLTSGKGDQEWLNTLVKRGIISSGATGIPLTSGAGGAAFGDLSYAQKRQRDIENLQTQQAFVGQSNQEVMSAMAQGMGLAQAKRAAEAQNAAQRNAWMAGIFNQAGNLGQLTSQAQQNVLNTAESVANQGMAQQQGLLQAGQNFANQGFATQANLLQAGQSLAASQAAQQQGLLQAGQGLANQGFAAQNQLGQTAYGLGSQALQAQAGLLGAAQNLNQQTLGTQAGLLGQIAQTSMGNLQSLAGLQNQGYGNLMGAIQASNQQAYDYQKALYQGAVQNAASQNAMLGSALGTAGTVAGMALLACWVAREVYGEQNPAWLEFRDWLLSKGSPRLVKRYLKKGPQIAGYIATRPGWKAKLKTWMDRCRATLA